MEQKFLPVEKLKELTGISEHTWRHWIREGRVPSVKLGKRVLVRVEDFNRFIEKNLRSMDDENGTI